MLLGHRGCEHHHRIHGLAQSHETQSPQAPTPRPHQQHSEWVADSTDQCSHMVASPSGAEGHDDALELSFLRELAMEWEMAMELGRDLVQHANLPR